MKRELQKAHKHLRSAIWRLEDLEALYPGAQLALANVSALDLRPALEGLEYAIELADD